MSVVEPPFNTNIHTSSGSFQIRDEYDVVAVKIDAAYESKNPFIEVTDNHGRRMLIPVGTILIVTTPN